MCPTCAVVSRVVTFYQRKVLNVGGNMFQFFLKITRSSQSIKIGKSDLIDIDCIDHSVEIDDTLTSFIDLSRFY